MTPETQMSCVIKLRASIVYGWIPMPAFEVELIELIEFVTASSSPTPCWLLVGRLRPTKPRRTLVGMNANIGSESICCNFYFYFSFFFFQ